MAVRTTWVADSGASHHMCNDRNSFISRKKLSADARITIKLGDQSSVMVTHYGRVRLQGAEFTALYTPTFRISLLSIGQFDMAGYTSTFGKGLCEISSGNHTISGRKRGNLYMVEAECMRNASAYASDLQAEPPVASPDEGGKSKRKRKRSIEATTAQPGSKTETARPGSKAISESRLWHRRLAHLHPAAMRSLIDGLIHEDTQCDVCVQAKHKQKSIRTMVKRTTTPYEFVHSDVCGPFATPTHKGYKYFILYIDDYSRYSDIYLLPNTLATTCMAAYNSFQARVEVRGHSIKQFPCDTGRGEYDNKNFRMILAGAGTTYEPCPPYAHHKNGVAERMSGVITEKARALMIGAQAPVEFWGEAVNTAN